MNTTTRAMLWESVAPRELPLWVGGVIGFTLPILLFTMLDYQGALRADEDSAAIMHMVMVAMNALAFGGLLVGRQWHVSRLFAAPLTTPSIVAWRILPAMTLMFVESLAWTLVIDRVIFHLGWPLWGPALASAVGVAAMLAATWLGQQSLWLVTLILGFAAPLGVWFKTRYLPAGIVGSARMWTDATLGDAAFLLAIAAVAYGVAIAGVSRNRVGEPPLSIGFVNWVQRLFKQTTASPAAFSSASAAQSWADWSRKGLLMPGNGLLVMTIGLLIWLFDRQTTSLLWGFLMGAVWLAAVAVISGMWFGNASATPTRQDMGSFMATRPMTARELASVSMRVGARSLLVTWGLWIVGFLLAAAAVRLVDGSLAVLVAPRTATTGFWVFYFAASLLGPWALMMLFAAAGLGGRIQMWMTLLGALWGVVVVVQLVTYFAVSPSAVDDVGRAMAMIGCVLVVAIVAWLFVRAWKRGHIVPVAGRVAIALWLAGSVGVLAWRPPLGTPVLGVLLSWALVALSVAPLATLPLAIQWNRVR